MLRSKMLIILGLKKITEDQIYSWERERNLSMLLFVLKRGNYRNRIRIIHILGRLKEYDRRTIIRLAAITRKDLLVVAKEAAELLRSIRVSRNTGDPDLIREAVAAYKERVRRRENKKGVISLYHGRQYKAAVPDKSRMEMLERVKQMLKKPIRLH